MKVKINNTMYENVQWTGASMIMETEMSLSEIESAFTPGASSDLIVYDGDQEVARFYNKGLESIIVRGSNPRTVEVAFDITQITPNAETEIRENIEDSDGAIEELAAMVAELSDLGMDEMAAELQSHQETINTWFSHTNDIVTFINDMRKEGGILDQFDARISALEHEVGIVSVEQNVKEEE